MKAIKEQLGIDFNTASCWYKPVMAVEIYTITTLAKIAIRNNIYNALAFPLITKLKGERL